MTLSLVLLVVMAVLYACGVYLILERSMTRVLLGFLLVGNATNLLIIGMAGMPGEAPIASDGTTAAEMTDPLPEALILTAIVITFGVSAFLLALIYRSWRLGQPDEVADDADDLAIAAEPLPEERIEVVPDSEFLDEPDDDSAHAGGDAASDDDQDAEPDADAARAAAASDERGRS